MKTTAVTANLTQLTRLHFVNAFLVREDDGFTLVDTTMGGRAAGELIAAAEQAGGTIRRIALTHGHGDHVGGLDALKERLGSSVEVLMPELDARIHAGEQVVEGKLPGSWPKIRTVPDVLLSAGDTVGSLEVVASPGHTPGHVAFLDRRDRSLIAGDVFTAYGSVAVTSHLYPRFPLAACRDLGQGDGPRLGARAARARPGRPRRRPRARHPESRRGDGQGDRPGGRLMPRAGLDPEAVVAAAAALADAEGLEAVTLAHLAGRLGVRAPSLYTHVAGLRDLRGRLAARGARELAAALQTAVAGRAGRDALVAAAGVYRAYAREHPGTYAATQRATDLEDPEAAAAAALVEVILAVLRGYGLEGEDAVHAARIVRASLHGFVSLEAGEGFRIPLDLDETFARLVAVLDRGLSRRS